MPLDGFVRSIASQLVGSGTSTVYHFGFSPSANAFTGVAFRSTNSFLPEVLPYGVGIKPPFEDVVASVNADPGSLGSPGRFVGLLKRLREIDDVLPVADRVGIGGEIHLLTMTETRQALHVVEAWPDFDVQYREMLRNLRKRTAGATGSSEGNEQ